MELAAVIAAKRAAAKTATKAAAAVKTASAAATLRRFGKGNRHGDGQQSRSDFDSKGLHCASPVEWWCSLGKDWPGWGGFRTITIGLASGDI